MSEVFEAVGADFAFPTPLKILDELSCGNSREAAESILIASSIYCEAFWASSVTECAKAALLAARLCEGGIDISSALAQQMLASCAQILQHGRKATKRLTEAGISYDIAQRASASPVAEGPARRLCMSPPTPARKLGPFAVGSEIGHGTYGVVHIAKALGCETVSRDACGSRPEPVAVSAGFTETLHSR